MRNFVPVAVFTHTNGTLIASPHPSSSPSHGVPGHGLIPPVAVAAPVDPAGARSAGRAGAHLERPVRSRDEGGGEDDAVLVIAGRGVVTGECRVRLAVAFGIAVYHLRFGTAVR